MREEENKISNTRKRRGENLAASFCLVIEGQVCQVRFQPLFVITGQGVEYPVGSGFIWRKNVSYGPPAVLEAYFTGFRCRISCDS